VIRAQRRGDARGAIAPVVARDGKPGQRQRIREVDEVLTDRRLLRHPRSGGISKTRRSVPTQVRHEYAVPLFHKGRRDAIPRAHIVGKSVQENDRKALRVAAFLETDVQDGCLDGSNRRRGGRLTRHERRRDCELQEVAAALVHQRLEAVCCALPPGAGGIGRDET
jgi:hypothetical protein